MPLTTEEVAKYVGGQMEIQNQLEYYVFRGEVGTIVVENNRLIVKFVWRAKADGFPPIRWFNDNDLDYQVGLDIYGASEIGDGRLALNSPITGELAVLFPPDGSKLDPSRVEGLQLARA